MDQFILFGDSLTQQAFSPDRGVLGPALTDAYIRRLDIVNRGFSGYNTHQALQILPRFMPSPSRANVRLMTTFLGANDSRLPDTPGGPQQHVQLEEFAANLKAITTHPCIRAHKDIKLLLITPPPLDEHMLQEADIAIQGRPLYARKASAVATYASAVREVGKELQLTVLDLWSVIMDRATPGFSHDVSAPHNLPGSMEAPANPRLQEFLCDGLHLSRVGYQILYDELMKTVERTWPELMPERLPFVYPRWDDEEAWSQSQES